MLNGTGDIKLVFWQCVTLVFPGLAVIDTWSCFVSETNSVLTRTRFFPAFVFVALDTVHKMMSIDARDTTSMLKGKESHDSNSTETEEYTTDATWTDDSIWLSYYDSSTTESTMSTCEECPTDATWTDDSFWLEYYDSPATGFTAANNVTSVDNGEGAKPWKKTRRGCRGGRRVQAMKARQAAAAATCPDGSQEAEAPGPSAPLEADDPDADASEEADVPETV